MYNSPDIKYRPSLIEENPALLLWGLVLGGYLILVLIAKYAWYISDRQIVEFTLWLVLLVVAVFIGYRTNSGSTSSGSTPAAWP